jgi:hypothetical protein
MEKFRKICCRIRRKKPSRGRRIMSSRPVQAKLARLYDRNKNKNKRACGLSQAVVHLPGMHVTLGSIPSTTKIIKTGGKKPNNFK